VCRCEYKWLAVLKEARKSTTADRPRECAMSPYSCCEGPIKQTPPT